MPTSLTVLAIKVLDIPNATQITANGINDHGQLVGQFNDKNGVAHGVIWEADSFSQIDYPGMSAINLYKINNLGQFVGSVNDPQGTVHGFFYDHGTFSLPLSFPGAGATYTLGLNNRGEIVGTYYRAAKSYGFQFRAGRYSSPAPPSGLQTGFQAINDAGQVAGIWVDAQGTHGVSYLDSVGLFTPHFDVPGAVVTYPQAINAGGQIGGQYTDANGIGKAFISLDGSLVTVDIPGSISASILGINSVGQICGNFVDSSQVHHSYVAALAL
jgi:uncharacterized membrane protein